MYEKLHRWTNEDEAVAVADRADVIDTEEIQPHDEESRVIDYKRRIRPEDDEF